MLMCDEARIRLMVACVQCNLYMLSKQLFETAKQVFAEIDKGTRIKSTGEHNDKSIRIKRQAITERTSHACPGLNSTCLPAFIPTWQEHNKSVSGFVKGARVESPRAHYKSIRIKWQAIPDNKNNITKNGAGSQCLMCVRSRIDIKLWSHWDLCLISQGCRIE
jgi:hypothetical protein